MTKSFGALTRRLLARAPFVVMVVAVLMITLMAFGCGDKPEEEGQASCDSLRAEAARDLCYLNEAKASLDINDCQNIKDTISRDKCFYDVLEIRYYGVDCDIYEGEMRDTCLAASGDLTGDSSFCEGIISLSVRDDCYLTIGKRLSLLDCGAINDASKRSECLSALKRG